MMVACEMETALAPLWVASAALGVAPHTWLPLAASTALGRSPRILSALSLAIHGVLLALVVLDCVFWSDSRRFVDWLLATFLWTVSLSAPAIFVTRGLAINKHKMAELRRHLGEANTLLRGSDVVQNVRRDIILKLILITVMLVFDLFTGIYTWDMPTWGIFIQCFTFLQNMLVLLQYQHIVGIINQDFIVLKRTLDNIIQEMQPGSKHKCNISCFAISETQIPRCSKSKKSLLEIHIEQLRNIKMAYYNLGRSCSYINEMYGFHIACYLSFTVIFTTCCMYFSILAVWLNIWNGYVWPIIVLCVSILSALLPSGNLIYRCQQTVNTVDCIKYSLTALLLTPNNPVLAQEVKNFLWQISTTNKVKFTANGFFHIDYKLITTFMSTICAYLVIAIQFVPVSQHSYNKIN